MNVTVVANRNKPEEVVEVPRDEVSDLPIGELPVGDMRPTLRIRRSDNGQWLFFVNDHQRPWPWLRPTPEEEAQGGWNHMEAELRSQVNPPRDLPVHWNGMMWEDFVAQHDEERLEQERAEEATRELRRGGLPPFCELLAR